MTHTILLTVDYHDQNSVVRQRHLTNHQESVTTLPTTADDLSQLIAQARKAVGLGGRLVWVQENTTGWARVKALLGQRVDEFALANVLQMPRPPKARRRKTDRTDTAEKSQDAWLGSAIDHDRPNAQEEECNRTLLTKRR